MPPTPVNDELLARWFPAWQATFERMGSGVSTPVYRAMVEGAVTYLRLAEHPGESREAEVRAHELVRELGIHVPEILRYEPAPPELDRSAALTAAMPGVPLDAYAGDPTAMLRAAGRDLARINWIPVRGWGWVRGVDGDGDLVAEHETRAAWAAEYRAAADRLRAEGELDPCILTALDAAITRWAALPESGTSHLAHGDVDTGHIYVGPDTGTYQGMIDFGEIRGADRYYDLGQHLVTEPDRAPALWAGYGEVSPVDPAGVRLQAIAIATRALAIQLDRTDVDWRAYLTTRLLTLLSG